MTEGRWWLLAVWWTLLPAFIAGITASQLGLHEWYWGVACGVVGGALGLAVHAAAYRAPR